MELNLSGNKNSWKCVIFGVTLIVGNCDSSNINKHHTHLIKMCLPVDIVE